jgi:hypothetical protein
MNATCVLRCRCALRKAAIAKLTSRGLYRAEDDQSHLLAIDAENHQSAIGQILQAVEAATGNKCEGLEVETVELESEPPE